MQYSCITFFELYNSVLGIRVQSPVAGLSRSCLSPACNLEMEFRSLEVQKNRAKRVQIRREVCRQTFVCFEVVVLVTNIISFIKVEVMILCVVDFEMLEHLYYTC